MTGVVNGYATDQELDSYIAAANAEVSIGLENRADELDAAINAASRAIDAYTGRLFYDTGAATARVYPADSYGRIHVDDFHTTTGLVVATDPGGTGTFGTTWTTSDYQLEPLNGVFGGHTGWPYNSIRATGTRTFPVSTEALVQVTASWGWAAVPAEVRQACLIIAHGMFLRNESPFGVAGFSEFGAVRMTPFDRQAAQMLAPFVRHAHLTA